MTISKNIVTASVKIKGSRAILWHRFGPEVLSLEKKEKCGVAGNNPDEWKSTVLKTEENQLFVEPSYIFACIRDGAKYTRKGRGTLQTSISATLQVLEERILFDRYLPEILTTDQNNLVYLDVRSVRNPVTKARNIRYRVCSSPGWSAIFKIAWDKTVISKNEMNAVLIDAGMFSGLGDARNIGFGRFEVEEFMVTENA
ncbi:hypothetical protein [Clostridium sp. BNL1100]|uniref:hypothetical protein n=1 Tax=Clostridium sp. BNL1100 TaxID=755731 RepID=UPI00024A7C95|nr:hypothetical protein [Clostridium sp. BNL1100]AEY65748.1 hypothetical protein Clo1100_1519 [Clostridium sp. BNL1100]